MSEAIEMYKDFEIGEAVEIRRKWKTRGYHGDEDLRAYIVTRAPDGIIYAPKGTVDKVPGIFVSFFDLAAVELPECISGPEDGTLAITRELFDLLEAKSTLQDRVSAWQAETFPGSDIPAKIGHLKKEVDELKRSGTGARILEEAADCLLLLFGIAALAGGEPPRRGREKAPDQSGADLGRAGR